MPSKAIVKPETVPSLVRLEEATRMIAECRSLDDLRDLRAQAEAFRAYSKQRGLSLAAMNDAAEIKLRAERRLGDLLAEMPKNNGGRPAKTDDGVSSVSPARLRDLGVETKQSERWQKEAAVPDEVFDEYLRAARDGGDEITQVGLLKLAGGSRPANWQSESVEWYTPAKYTDAAREVLGGIDLDPASSPQANKEVGATRIFTREDDGLTRPWKGRVWLNPPYGETDGESSAGVWSAYLINQFRIGDVTAAVLLVNAVTDRGWFQPLWEFPICFTDHRIEFYTPAGQPRSPVNGNAFVYFGRDVRAFVGAFSGFGAVVGRLIP